MSNFLIALSKTLPHEGYYSNRPADRGGETYAGISRKYWPDWRGWQIIDKAKPLKQNQQIVSKHLDNLIQVFYYDNFFKPLRGDQITSQSVCNFIFDWYVNSGGKAIKKVQIAVNAAPDGIIGSKTLAAINSADPAGLFHQLKDSRIQYVHAIVRNDPAQAVNLNGWLKRINSFNNQQSNVF